jgi:hypothetical protein
VESCRKILSCAFSRLRTILPINLFGTGDGSRSRQSFRQGAGRKDVKDMTWRVSMEITPSVVCVSSQSGQVVCKHGR